MAEHVAPAPITWTPEEADRLHDEWSFNCGPASICAVTGMQPRQLRPFLGDFERKGYTNPTLMLETLRRIDVRYTRMRELDWPRFGLVRIQWHGPWMREGVPMAARYRHTHWVGSIGESGTLRVFDVNATCVGGWLPFDEWAYRLVPWLIKECVPKGDGGWSITHALYLGSPYAVAHAVADAKAATGP